MRIYSDLKQTFRSGCAQVKRPRTMLGAAGFVAKDVVKHPKQAGRAAKFVVKDYVRHKTGRHTNYPRTDGSEPKQPSHLKKSLHKIHDAFKKKDDLHTPCAKTASNQPIHVPLRRPGQVSPHDKAATVRIPASLPTRQSQPLGVRTRPVTSHTDLYRQQASENTTKTHVISKNPVPARQHTPEDTGTGALITTGLVGLSLVGSAMGQDMMQPTGSVACKMATGALSGLAGSAMAVGTGSLLTGGNVLGTIGESVRNMSPVTGAALSVATVTATAALGTAAQSLVATDTTTSITGAAFGAAGAAASIAAVGTATLYGLVYTGKVIDRVIGE